MKLPDMLVLTGLVLAICTTRVHAFCPLALPHYKEGATASVLRAEAVDDKATNKDYKYCLPLEKVSLTDLPRVGGKTASLGEMIQQLTPLGVDVPGGFAVTADAYDAVLDRFSLRERLELLLDGIDGKYNGRHCVGSSTRKRAIFSLPLLPFWICFTSRRRQWVRIDLSSRHPFPYLVIDYSG